MFGYVKPYVFNLRVCENECYKAFYCGFCRQLGRKFCQFSRLTLSYDGVFFLIFSLGIFKEDFKNLKFEKKFCIFHPFKRRMCLKSGKALELALGVNLIFSYFKLDDIICDEKKFRKILARFLKLFLRRSFKKACDENGNVLKIVEEYVKNQKELEKKTNFSLDQACHPTAHCLGKVMESLNLKCGKELYRIGYMLGRYIYIVDAVDDLEKDFKLNRFNPFLNIFKCSKRGKKDKFSSLKIADISKKALSAINYSVAQLEEAYSSLEKTAYSSMVENVIYFGLNEEKTKVFKKLDGLKF